MAITAPGAVRPYAVFTRQVAYSQGSREKHQSPQRWYWRHRSRHRDSGTPCRWRAERRSCDRGLARTEEH